MADSQEPDLRILLVGKIGVGKSATGNTILGKKVFESMLRPKTVTKVCQMETGEFEDLKLAVVDTPGLFDTDNTIEVVKTEITRSISLSAPGPHVILVVLHAGRFTKEEEALIKTIQEMFGKEAVRYTLVLFTHKEDLMEEEGVSTDELIGQNEFISQCHGGFHAFNNRDQDPAQVSDLLNKIKKMVKRNGGRYYTNEMFKEAERVQKEEMRNSFFQSIVQSGAVVAALGAVAVLVMAAMREVK